MKYFPLALACTLAGTLTLSACGGSDNSPALAAAVPPPGGMDGTWHASTISDGNGNTVNLPTGDFYLVLSNSNENPMRSTMYMMSDTQNCLDKITSNMTHIGNDRYRDEAGDVGRIAVSNNTLAMSFTEDGLTLTINMSIDTTIVEADLPVCGVQNDDGGLLQNDQPEVRPMQSMFDFANGQ